VNLALWLNLKPALFYNKFLIFFKLKITLVNSRKLHEDECKGHIEKCHTHTLQIVNLNVIIHCIVTDRFNSSGQVFAENLDNHAYLFSVYSSIPETYPKYRLASLLLLSESHDALA